MSLGTILLAIWLILLGITFLTWVNISYQFLGGFAAVVGIILLVEGYHPITLFKR